MKRIDNTGYIPLNRRFFKHPFWTEPRVYSKAEAWIDLVQTARFEDSRAHELIRGKLISWTKGQLIASVRFLSKRWSWDKNKVDRFLKFLETEKMIARHQIHGETVLALINYEAYNNKGQVTGQSKRQSNHLQSTTFTDEQYSEWDSDGDTRGTEAGQRRDKTNKENKGNKVNKEGESAGAHPGPVKKVPHLFRESEIFEKEKFFAALADRRFSNADLDHYHEVICNWSDSKASKKIDWLATCRNWLIRDLKDGKIITKHAYGTHQQSTGKNGNDPKPGTSAARMETARRW